MQLFDRYGWFYTFKVEKEAPDKARIPHEFRGKEGFARNWFLMQDVMRQAPKSVHPRSLQPMSSFAFLMTASQQGELRQWVGQATLNVQQEEEDLDDEIATPFWRMETEASFLGSEMLPALNQFASQSSSSTVLLDSPSGKKRKLLEQARHNVEVSSPNGDIKMKITTRMGTSPSMVNVA